MGSTVNEVMKRHAAQNEQPKFCKDCKHLAEIAADYCPDYVCNFGNLDLVTGRRETIKAHEARKPQIGYQNSIGFSPPQIPCGPEARYFEPKDAR